MNKSDVANIAIDMFRYFNINDELMSRCVDMTVKVSSQDVQIDLTLYAETNGSLDNRETFKVILEKQE